MTFIDLLDQLEIPFKDKGHEHCRPGWVQLDCPYCSPGWEHWRLGYNIRYGYLNCWTCGGKRIVDTLCELAPKLSPGEAHRLLKKVDEVDELSPREHRTRPGRLQLPKSVVDLTPQDARKHWSYLRQRFPHHDVMDIIKLWNVQAIRQTTQYSWRLFIPITIAGEVVSWTTRSISDRPQKRYINAPGDHEKVSAKSVLYGADRAGPGIVICEGPLDAWAIGPGGTAIMGLTYSQAQIEQMARHPFRVIWFDGERAAQRRARKLADDLSQFEGETSVLTFSEKVKDAASADRETLDCVRRLLH